MNLKELRGQLGFVRFYLVALFILSSVFYAGHEFADKRNHLLIDELEVMHSSVANLSAENQALNTQLNVKKVELEVASIANEQAQISYKELMQKRVLLQEQISFYQKVMAPELTQDGFVVESVEVSSTASANNYIMKVMMLQRESIKSVIKGTLKISLRGSQNQVPIQYDLAKLLDGENQNLAFSFKYFQVLELRLTMPESFVPEQIEISTDVYKFKRLRGSYSRSIKWADAYSESD